MDNTQAKPTITIDDVPYDLDSLSDQAKFLIGHVQDLDRKVQKAQFEFDQLRFSRESFFAALQRELPKPPANQ